MIKNILTTIQILLSIILIALTFLQSKGDSESRSNILSVVNFEKRGWEKVLFNTTVIIAICFLASSIIQVII